MQAPAVIELNDFSFSYGSKTVFESLSLKMEQGSIHGILGANGVGKSTLFNNVFYHHQHEAITVAGGVEKELAYLQTEPYFYPYMTGMEYLKIVGTPEKKEQIEDWNQLFQLPLSEYVHNYSTGMKKKIGLLGNVLLDKKILLLDEPTNGLDLEASEYFKALIARMKERGTTVILSSHILESLFTTCDRITLLSGPGSAFTYERAAFEELRLAVQADYTDKKQAILNGLLPL